MTAKELDDLIFLLCKRYNFEIADAEAILGLLDYFAEKSEEKYKRGYQDGFSCGINENNRRK